MSADVNRDVVPLRTVRDLPHSLEAEQAVLGAVLSDEAALDQVVGMLAPRDFYDVAHQRVYEACVELAKEGKPLDAVMVGQWLDAKGLLGSAVPRELPFQLQRAVGTTTNVGQYAETVSGLAQLRTTMLVAQALVDRGYDAGANVQAFLDAAQREVAAASAPVVDTGPVRLSLDRVKNPPRELFVLGNLIPLRKVSVFYGPTSIGKSAAAAQIVLAFASGTESLWGLPIHRDERSGEIGGPVLVYSVEDTREDWERKAGAVLVAGGIDVEKALSRFQVLDRTEGMARFSEEVTLREPDFAIPSRTVTRKVTRATPERERLIAMARKDGVKLILVETASRLVDDEDNSSFSALQAALGHVARETGAAVLLTHHPTKAATKENDSAVESARGGGALIANGRNALSLFPADSDAKKPYQDRFPGEDIVVLTHGKPTSSTRRMPPIVLIRTDATWGAVFRLPEEVQLTGEQQARNTERIAQEREEEAEKLRRLYSVVEKYLPTRPKISPSWLRDHHYKEIKVPKNGAAGVEALITRAIALGFLRVASQSDRGITLALGFDPRKPIVASNDDLRGEG